MVNKRVIQIICIRKYWTHRYLHSFNDYCDHQPSWLFSFFLQVTILWIQLGDFLFSKMTLPAMLTTGNKVTKVTIVETDNGVTNSKCVAWPETPIWLLWFLINAYQEENMKDCSLNPVSVPWVPVHWDKFCLEPSTRTVKSSLWKSGDIETPCISHMHIAQTWPKPYDAVQWNIVSTCTYMYHGSEIYGSDSGSLFDNHVTPTGHIFLLIAFRSSVFLQ